MTRDELTSRHWYYYLMLERRFIDTIQYVDLSSDNEKCYSDVFALLIQAIGAELDCVFKVFCDFGADERRNIGEYVVAIDVRERQNSTAYPIRAQKVMIPEYGIELQPFKHWDVNKAAGSLAWWEAFTDIKHNRFGNRTQANQQNVLNALAALYLVEMLLLKKVTDGTSELDVFDRGSELFTIKNWTTKAIPMNTAFAVLGEMMAGEDQAVSQKSYDA